MRPAPFHLTAWLLALSLWRPACARADELATWQSLSLKYLDTPKVDLVFYGESRTSFEPSRYGGYLLSQQVKFNLHTNLMAGLNYTFLSVPSANSDELKDTHRAEFELEPVFTVGGGQQRSCRADPPSSPARNSGPG